MEVISTIKDLSPTVIGIAALILSSRNISIQIRKNKKADWINDFRKEVANILTYFKAADSVRFELGAEAYDMNLKKSVLIVKMFLNPSDSLHRQLNLF